MQEHLSHCAKCSALALDLGRLHSAMAELTAEVPEGFSDRVMERIRQKGEAERGAAQTIKRKTRWVIWGGLAAALLIAAIGTGRPALPGPALSGGSTALSPAAVPAPGSAKEDSGTCRAGVAEPAGDEEETRLFMSAPQYEKESPVQKDNTLSGSFSAPKPENAGEALTALEAAYKVTETFSAPLAADYTATDEDGPVTLGFEVDGVAYTLEYTGLTGDDTSYLFALKGEDGTHQIWAVSVDGQSVGQREN